MNLLLKKSWVFRFALNAWPPMLFAGIRIKHMSADFKTARVELKLRPWNKNAVGTHFGGSLFAMTDPFCMLMLLAQLGDEYVVWDKSADIDFMKPGKGKVSVDFAINQNIIDDIITRTQNGDKYLPQIPVFIKDEQGDVVAKVNRTLYIRRKIKTS